MDGQNYVIFHDAADSSYTNTTANFRGAYGSGQVVTAYFKAAAVGNAGTSAGYDAIAMACTDGEEDRAIEQLAAVMSGSGPKGRITVIADDVNSIYACQDISAVNSITLSATGTFKAFEAKTANFTLVKSDSGKTFRLDAAAGMSAIILPVIASAGAGWWCKFIVGTANSSNTYVITETVASDTNKLCTTGLEVADGAQIYNAAHTLITSQTDASIGDSVEVFCDGTTYFCTTISQDADGWVLS